MYVKHLQPVALDHFRLIEISTSAIFTHIYTYCIYIYVYILFTYSIYIFCIISKYIYIYISSLDADI